MRILMVHNYYKTRGGEDIVFENEVKMLREKGHKVEVYTKNNLDIDEMNIISKSTIPFSTIWSREAFNAIKKIIKDFKPDIAHFHNTFPLISPSAYYACREEGIPVVQTLHNYRLICPSANLFRDGSICEMCVNGGLINSVKYKCYRGSTVQSATVAYMLKYHNNKNTWKNFIDKYIVLSEFSKKKFAEYEILPLEKIEIKPNFLEYDPLTSNDDIKINRVYGLFVGRLDKVKGIKTLLQACERLESNEYLYIIGDGDLKEWLKSEIIENDLQNVIFLGRKNFNETLNYIKNANFLVMPSIWYEPFGRTIIEAFACGIPVIGSDIGAVGEIVEDNKTGLLFKAQDYKELSTLMKKLFSNPELSNKLGMNARKKYLEKYTIEINYRELISIYNQVLPN